MTARPVAMANTTQIAVKYTVPRRAWRPPRALPAAPGTAARSTARGCRASPRPPPPRSLGSMATHAVTLLPDRCSWKDQGVALLPMRAEVLKGHLDGLLLAALDDFGTTEEIVAGFAHLVPGRRTARALLASGPLLGGCWAITLLASHAWRWPIPVAGRVGFAALLLGVVAVLAMTARASYRHTRRSAALAGISGLLLLDASAIVAVTVLAPTPQWPLLLGITASLSRICLTAPTLRSLLITR